jgi:hypothetical protein
MAEATNTRKPLSKRVRFEVFKRDLFCCQYCGSHPPTVVLEVDHITPVAEGGGDEEANLITSCFNCNRGKAAVPLSVVPKSLAEKGAETAEREEQIAGYRTIMQARADRIEEDAWEVAEILFPGAQAGIKRDWFRSIKTFNERMDLHDVKEAAELARDLGPYRDKGRFLYFCKVCWNKIREAA